MAIRSIPRQDPVSPESRNADGPSSVLKTAAVWLAVWVGALHLASPAIAETADWPYWRGPRFDGQANASGLPDTWDPSGGEGSNLLWSRDDIGGPCTPIVMNGRLYTIQRAEPSTPREGERVVCLDASSGETLWENRFNVWMSDVPAERVGWSSVVGDQETGNVYHLGSCCLFQCLDGETGETIWNRPLHEEFGMLSTYGGRTNFPIIHEDLVIISGVIINWGERAQPNHRLIAMDKKTGEVVWFTGTRNLPYDTAYSAPSLVTIDGQRQLILGTGDGSVWGFQPRTGKPLWDFKLSRRGIYLTPLIVGNRVYAGHSEENTANNSMGAMVGLEISGTGDATEVKELWRHEELVVGYSEPVLLDNRLYVLDDRCKMWVIDVDTGEFLVERKAFVGSRQRASLTYADGKIFVMSESGPWAFIEPTEDGFEVISKGRLRNTQFAASPIVADGNVFLQSTDTLYCIGTGEGTQEAVRMADVMGEETPVDRHLEIAQVQVIPCEALLRPGESVDLQVRVFNALGQRLADPAEVTWEVEGAAAIDGNTLTADPAAGHTAAFVTARVNGVPGESSVRIVPPLPWKFDFSDYQDAPLPWLGARYRHVVREVDGAPALVKVTTIPKGARSRAWMGPSDLSDYTISADVRGARMSEQLPDIGLTNLGYALDLMGESQELQIRTWAAQLRMAKTVPFPWREDTWYRMKFRADVESRGNAPVAILRGKVWPRDESEPEEWTITAIDESPNLTASPGLYGNARVAELYLNNIEVVPNGDAAPE